MGVIETPLLPHYAEKHQLGFLKFCRRLPYPVFLFWSTCLILNRVYFFSCCFFLSYVQWWDGMGRTEKASRRQHRDLFCNSIWCSQAIRWCPMANPLREGQLQAAGGGGMGEGLGSARIATRLAHCAPLISVPEQLS